MHVDCSKFQQIGSQQIHGQAFDSKYGKVTEPYNMIQLFSLIHARFLVHLGLREATSLIPSVPTLFPLGSTIFPSHAINGVLDFV